MRYLLTMSSFQLNECIYNCRLVWRGVPEPELRRPLPGPRAVQEWNLSLRQEQIYFSCCKNVVLRKSAKTFAKKTQTKLDQDFYTIMLFFE